MGQYLQTPPTLTLAISKDLKGDQSGNGECWEFLGVDLLGQGIIRRTRYTFFADYLYFFFFLNTRFKRNIDTYL